MNLDGQRRSSRHRRVRGEKEVIASSSNTLKELKIKVHYASLYEVTWYHVRVFTRVENLRKSNFSNAISKPGKIMICFEKEIYGKMLFLKHKGI